MLWLALACSPPPDRPVAASPEDTAVPVEPTPPTTLGTTPTTPTPTTPGTTPTLDCSALPATATLVQELAFMPGFEDFTFGADGDAWGVSYPESDLVRVPYGGPPEVLLPAVSTIPRGTRFLLDGDLAVVDYTDDAIVRIDTSTFAKTVLATGLQSPNGLAVGTDGFVYLSENTGDVRRIDPATGQAPVFVHSPVSNDGISFSPDYLTLYLDSDTTTDFLALGVDGAGGVTSPVARVATLASVSDGMAVDACGNAYVTQLSPPGIARVHPDGTVEALVSLPADAEVVSVNFGSGLGGWEATHLFLAGFGRAFEYDVGVPGKWEPHLPPP